MKKASFLTIVLAFTITTLMSQINTKVGKPELAKPTTKIIKPTQVSPPPPPPPPAAANTTSNKTTAATNQSTLVYSLTAVRVNIRTGNDNKEFPSKAMVLLRSKTAATGDWSPFAQVNLDNEMRVNSNSEFGLERDVQLRGEAKLEALQKNGLKLIIEYIPNFIADAWKIENVSIVLEFKDQFNNLHPTLGSKTIVFSNAYGFLDNKYRVMVCTTDQGFNPLTANIQEWY